MTTHDRFLQLAAAAIDYPLTPAERGRLEAHLADCPVCVRSAAGLRADAMTLADLPTVTLPERRAAEILAAALHPATVRSPLRLVGLAALLALLLLGALVAGSELARRLDTEDLSVVLPVSTETPGPSSDPSFGPSEGPAAPSGVLAVTHGDETGDKTWVELVTLATGAQAALGFGSDPAWGSDGVLVYACTKRPGDTAVCMTDTADLGEPPSEIASGAGRPVLAPYTSDVVMHRGTVDSGETWLMRAGDREPRRLATGSFLQWSPDALWLLGQPESATFEVAIIGVDDSNPRVLAPGYDPAWSPEGRRIVYALVDGEVASLREVDVADAEVRVLYTAPAGASLTAPAYLPRGRVVFVLDGDLWRLDTGVGSNNPVRLTTGLDIRADWFGDALTVSPDGAWVAFSTGSGAGARVGIASVEGGYRMLELGPGPVTQPQWAPALAPEPAATPSDQGQMLGDAWIEVGLPAPGDRAIGVVEAVTAGGPGFVAVGRGCVGETRCEGIVWLSTDGSSWTRTSASSETEIGSVFVTSGPELGMFDVAAGTPGIVATGYAALPDLRATTWFSANGTSWERHALGDGAARVHAVAWDGQRFVMVGEDRSDLATATLAAAEARAAVWTSPDGRTWTRVPHTAALDVGGFIDTMEDPASGGMRDVAVGPEGLVAVGSVCTATPVGCRPAVWTSPDGISWSRVTDVPSTAGVLKAIASEVGIVAVGAETCGSSPAAIPGDCTAMVMTSVSGREWVQQAFGQAGDLRTVTRVGNRWFATSPDGPQNLWASADGSTWAAPLVAGGPATANGSGGISGWHFAATSNVAVWLGPSSETGDPSAWVSRR